MFETTCYLFNDLTQPFIPKTGSDPPGCVLLLWQTSDVRYLCVAPNGDMAMTMGQTLSQNGGSWGLLVLQGDILSALLRLTRGNYCAGVALVDGLHPPVLLPRAQLLAVIVGSRSVSVRITPHLADYAECLN